MEEWTDPLRVPRFRFAILLLIFVGILPAIAKASVRHSVFGLNPRMTYDVYVGGTAVMIGACPSPSGDLTFVAAAANPVRVVPNGTPQNAGTPTSPAHGIGVTPPMPNPTGGSFDLRVGVEQAGEVRITLIEAATGRARYTKRAMLPGGESPLRIELPDHLASGLYLIRVESGANAVVRKLLLLRNGGRSLKR